MLGYHTERIKQMNVWQQVDPSPDVRSFYCQPSSIASYHGSAMSAVMIRCRSSYYKEQSTVVVAEEDLVEHQGMDRPVDVVIAGHRR